MPFVVAAVGAIIGVIGAAGAFVGGILGISAGLGTALLVTTAITIGKSLLRGGQTEPSRENLNRLRATIDVRAPRKTVVGITAMATDIRDEEFTDDQGNLQRFIVCASHKIESIDEVWFDDKLAWTPGGGVTADYSPDLVVYVVTEGNAGNAHNVSARMGTSRRFTGCAYIRFNYRLVDENAKFAQTVPTRITIRGKGAALYDPRMDDTVPGGDGDQRADDQTTWVWDDDACRNPALALLFYLLGYRIQNPDTDVWLLAVGKGIPQERIDLESFAVAANICDEEMATEDAGTEPRYRCDGVWSEGDSPTTVIDMLKATMNADLDDVDGRLRLTVFHNDLATIDAEFTDEDVLGAFEWIPETPLEQSFNIVRGVYTDPSDESLYQPVDYPQVEVPSPDGIDRIKTLNLPMVQSPGQAQRIAALLLARDTYGGGSFTADFQATAWRVQKNSVVKLSFAPTGFVEKLFRVAEMELRVDGVVPLALVPEAAEIYDPPDLLPAVDPVPSTPYDPTLNPIVGAISGTANAIDQGLIVSSWQSLDVAITGTTSSITINNHSRIYNDKTVSVTGDTIPGLADATAYYLYYDDSARAGGVVTWHADTDYTVALNSSVHSARHYGGVIVTGAAAVGFGVLPPGSYDYIP